MKFSQVLLLSSLLQSLGALNHFVNGADVYSNQYLRETNKHEIEWTGARILEKDVSLSLKFFFEKV